MTLPLISRLRDAKNTLAFQVAVVILAFTLLIFVLMIILNGFMIKRVMMVNAQDTAQYISRQNLLQLERILESLETQAHNAAYGILAPNPVYANREYFYHRVLTANPNINSLCIAYTPEFTKKNPTFISRVFYLKGDSLVVKLLSTPTNDYLYQDWYIIPKTLREPYWTEPWYDMAGKQQLISSYSIPLYDKNREFIGIVRMDVTVRVLQQVVASIHILKTGYAFLITKNGTIVTHPADSLMMNYSIFSYARYYGNGELRELGKRMQSQKEGFERFYDQSGNKQWIYYAPVKLNAWSLGVVFSSKEIFGDLNRLILVFNIILFLGFVLVFVVIYWRTQRMFKPLRALLFATDKIGRGDFSAELPQLNVDNEIKQLTDEFRKMQNELQSYLDTIVASNRAKEKIETELRFAAEIQTNLIPTHLNEISRMSEVTVFGVLEPAGEIGGDLYDVFMLDEHTMCFAIADVFGKGIVASMIMIMMQTLIRTNAKHLRDLKSLVREVNLFLCENNKQSHFVTMILGTLDLDNGRMEYCNSGHTPLYIKKKSLECQRYGETHNTALGIFTNLAIDSSTLILEPGDEMVLFTDGITEAMSSNESFFGYQRLERVIADITSTTPEVTVSKILEAVREFSGKQRQNDDVTILSILFNHPREKSGA